jgi:CRP-like cAMP-binding protein
MEKLILVIEDNPEMLDNIVGILQLAKYNVITAFNGKIGVNMAHEQKPDLIICDVMMPELDGFGVLHLLRKDTATADIPFIFLTAKDEKKEWRKGMNLGADDYITKPFDGLELLSAVEMRLMKSQLLNANFQPGPEGIDHFFKEAKKLREFYKLTDNRISRKYKKKEMIYLEGQQQSEMFFVKSGQVKTYKTNQDGKELILAFHNAGDFFGYVPLLENTGSSESAVALEETEVYTIPKQDFLTIIYTHREIARKFIKMLANNLHEAEVRLLELAYQSVRQKVAGALLKIYRQYAPAKSHQLITISRRDLSGLIGTATESLNRTLADFKEEGLIDITEDGIVILNSRAIADLLI